MKKYKLIDLNIELDQNIKRIEPFLFKNKPDFFCAQEISLKTFNKWKDKYFLDGFFVQMVSGDSLPYGEWGLAIFSNYHISRVESVIYDDFAEDYVEFKDTRSERPLSILLTVGFKELGDVRISTTHFTWSANAKANNQQRKNIDNLIGLLDNYEDIILCGDFNAPRGGEIFDKLSTKIIDNIPTGWHTTIDPSLHQAGKLDILVDGIFSKGKVQISDVKQVFGVSDHSAITCTFNI